MHRYLRALGFVVLVLATAMSVACGAAPVRPDSELMRGWTATEIDLGEARLQLDHPAGWPTTFEKKADDLHAGSIRVVTPSPGGPRLDVTAFAGKGLPTDKAKVDAESRRLLDAVVAGLGARSKRGEIMNVETTHGGTYKVVLVEDPSVPAEGFRPEQYRFLTIGVMIQSGFIVNFSVFHHEEAPPQGEELLGMVRTVRFGGSGAAKTP